MWCHLLRRHNLLGLSPATITPIHASTLTITTGHAVAGVAATSKPTVVDVTVTSERAIRNRSLACAAEDAEKRKNDKYADLYARINYEFVGFAVEVGGRLGPSASTFLGKLRERWESKMGRRAVPEDANWSCPSFTSYWRQRIVASVQLHSASLFLARARRMAELQLAGAGQV